MALAALAALAPTERALAQTADAVRGDAAVREDGAPRVELALEGAWADPLRVAVRADLEASLRAQRIELVHAADGAERVVATIRITAPSPSVPACLVRIDDAITGKHVERAVDLARVPVDGWSVAIAAGADELLRASWAELAIEDAPPPAIDPPDAIAAIVEERIVGPRVERRVAEALSPPLPRPALALGAGFAVEGYLGGQTLLGGDVRVRLWLVDRVGVDLALGGRGGLDVAGEAGVVRSWALGGDLGPTFLLVPAPSPVRLEAFAALRASYLRFDAEANAGFVAGGAEGLAMIGRAGLRASLAIDRTEVGLAIGAGVPLLGLEARDERGAITGVSGLEISGALSMMVEALP